MYSISTTKFKKSRHFLRLVRIPEAVFLLLALVSAGVVTEE